MTAILLGLKLDARTDVRLPIPATVCGNSRAATIFVASAARTASGGYIDICSVACNSCLTIPGGVPLSSRLKSVHGQRILATCVLIALAGIAIAVRYILFQHGVLYGETAAKMASLAVAGIIIVAGYIPLRVLSHGNHEHAGDSATESIVATVAAILGLALTAYSVSELVAPNTPTAASVPACAGVPVYGAEYFAVTEQNGVNARSGPGPQYPQVHRYPTGFDGYCIGAAERDFVIGTPDQRWLIVRNRKQLISAAVVLSESAESDLGTAPNPRCAALGGLPQPHAITQFTYNTSNGGLNASAPGAALIGYGIATLNSGNPDFNVGTLGTNANSHFPAHFAPSLLEGYVQGATGQVLLGAAVCLAVNVPVTGSLRARLLTIRNSRIIHDAQDTHISPNVIRRLAEIACNSTG